MFDFHFRSAMEDVVINISRARVPEMRAYKWICLMRKQLALMRGLWVGLCVGVEDWIYFSLSSILENEIHNAFDLCINSEVWI